MECELLKTRLLFEDEGPNIEGAQLLSKFY
jgi:hypothetical protein